MAQTTTLGKFPYPVDTDVADVPRDLKALADRLEAIRKSSLAVIIGADGALLGSNNGMGFTLDMPGNGLYIFTYSTQLPAKPIVLATAESSTVGVFAAVQQSDKAGCTVQVQKVIAGGATGTYATLHVEIRNLNP